ncbi:MAG: hypothetical protein QOE61_4961 [Micromonosporaceae bacterium]|jgi:hypothetical protein|nr:hypothetical protein [Micromonosporaceae bacterium]
MPGKDDLTPTESAILVVLMSENRAIRNPDLKEHFGFELKKPSREKLNRLNYVDTRVDGGVMVHRLGDAAWDRFREPLNFDGARPRAFGVALGSLLAAVRRDLERNNRSLAMAFAPELAEPAPRYEAEVELTDRIREAYVAIASAPRAWVSIADIRRKLGDVDRVKLDAALRRLEQATDVNIVPESNQKALSEEDRRAAVIIGDQPKHFLAIGV